MAPFKANAETVTSQQGEGAGTTDQDHFRVMTQQNQSERTLGGDEGRMPNFLISEEKILRKGGKKRKSEGKKM